MRVAGGGEGEGKGAELSVRVGPICVREGRDQSLQLCKVGGTGAQTCRGIKGLALKEHRADLFARHRLLLLLSVVLPSAHILQADSARKVLRAEHDLGSCASVVILPPAPDPAGADQPGEEPRPVAHLVREVVPCHERHVLEQEDEGAVRGRGERREV